MNKPTYPNLLGLEGAKKAADSLYNQALECLDGLDEKGNMLKAIADYIVNRNN